MYVIIPFFIHSQYSGRVPRFIDEPAPVGEESSVDGVENGEFSQSLHRKEQQKPHNHKTDELEQQVSNAAAAMLELIITYNTARSSVLERRARAHEKTSPNGAT